MIVTRLRFLPAIMVAAVLCSGGQSWAQPSKKDGPPGGPSKNNSKILDLFKSVVAKSAASTVSVLIDGKQVAFGTVVGADGFIITKDSELKSDKIVVKFKDGKELPATRISGDETWDIAMLKVDAKDLTPISWASSKIAPVGNWVATPAAAEKPVAIGVVSVSARTMPPGPKIALPKDNNNRGYLGIQMEDNDKGEGVRITVVSPKSPAERAGLKAEDIIVGIDGKDTPDRETLGASIGRHKAGDVVTIRYIRGAKEEEAKATLEKRPASLGFDRGDMQNSMGTDRSERRTGFPITLQHDTDLKASQCGGPLVDLDGNVIGINIARGGRTDTYAIPAESIQPLLPNLMKAKVVVVPKIPIAQRIKAAEDALKEAQTAKAAADKKLAEAKAALDKLLAEDKKEEKKEPKKDPPKEEKKDPKKDPKN
ncbi:MAG: S1C family serine protease [Planctomycetes bacterium]|nr:S1C family serine protease [Planctomycetota bacterium]